MRSNGRRAQCAIREARRTRRRAGNRGKKEAAARGRRVWRSSVSVDLVVPLRRCVWFLRLAAPACSSPGLVSLLRHSVGAWRCRSHKPLSFQSSAWDAPPRCRCVQPRVFVRGTASSVTLIVSAQFSHVPPSPGIPPSRPSPKQRACRRDTLRAAWSGARAISERAETNRRRTMQRSGDSATPARGTRPERQRVPPAEQTTQHSDSAGRGGRRSSDSDA